MDVVNDDRSSEELIRDSDDKTWSWKATAFWKSIKSWGKIKPRRTRFSWKKIAPCKNTGLWKSMIPWKKNNQQSDSKDSEHCEPEDAEPPIEDMPVRWMVQDPAMVTGNGRVLID